MVSLKRLVFIVIGSSKNCLLIVVVSSDYFLVAEVHLSDLMPCSLDLS